jgi:hypothetical protein
MLQTVLGAQVIVEIRNLVAYSATDETHGQSDPTFLLCFEFCPCLPIGAGRLRI